MYPIKASIIGAGSAKSVKALNRRIRWRETGILCQHDPDDVLVESLGLEKGNTVQTPTVGDVKDENPVWLDLEQIQQKTDLMWTDVLFFSQDRADITFAVSELRQRMSDPSQHSLATLKRLVRYLKGKATDPSVRIREHEFRGDSVSRVNRRSSSEAVQKQNCLQQHWERHKRQASRARCVTWVLQ